MNESTNYGGLAHGVGRSLMGNGFMIFILQEP